MTIDDYIVSCSSEEPKVLRELFRQTHLRVLQPRMLSGHVQGRFLALLTAIVAPRRVLELGTFTGYSTICMASMMAKNSKLHTIDVNDELEGMVTEFLEKADVQNIVIQHFGRALEVMPTFLESFDLVFIDADKREYLEYYNMLFDCNLIHSGTVIVADNTLWSEKVLTQIAKNDRQTIGVVRFNEFVSSDSRVEKVMLPLRDGVTIIRVK